MAETEKLTVEIAREGSDFQKGREVA